MGPMLTINYDDDGGDGDAGGNGDCDGARELLVDIVNTSLIVLVVYDVMLLL